MGVFLGTHTGKVDRVGPPIANPACLDVDNPALPPVIASEGVELHELEGVLGQGEVVLLLHAVLQVDQQQAGEQEAADAAGVGVAQPPKP